jgi:hypothetical protein
MVVLLKDVIHTSDVDWLAWEDPFIESCDPKQLKKIRESSVVETCKRLSYVVPMMQRIREAACA